MTGATTLAYDQHDKLTGDDPRLSNRLRALGLAQPALPTGLLSGLRGLMPRRALGSGEADQIAERQATRLRSWLEVEGPVLHEVALAALPWLTIRRRATLPTSGVATQTDHGWLIVLNSDEPMVRQRFSLAHELKHVLDHDLIDLPPAGLYPSRGGYSAHERAERVCDRFAGALLMPKILLRADWADGIQDIARLAKRYDVSRPAMRVRLSQLGLLEPTPRCAPLPNQHESQKGSTR